MVVAAYVRDAGIQPAQYNMEILIVTVPGFNKKAVQDITSEYPKTRVIDFYTTDMEELAVIAKNRILPVESVLVFKDQKVVARVVGRSFAVETVRAVVDLLKQ